VPGEVRHTFTHFHLHLTVRKAELLMHMTPERGEFLSPAQFRPTDLPTVMRKVFDLAIK
jgi:A/G-specific adenine glycosylase